MMNKFAAYNGQDYQKLRNQCLSEGKLFVDPQFSQLKKGYKWLRPREICKDPKFFINGFSRFDVNQGKLGNCWLIAAMANLTLNKSLFNQVVCEDNTDFQSPNYCGIFHFRFWHFGKFVDVVVDDRLPTSHGKLIYSTSSERGEFWSALLEKAYAKMYGGYDEIDGGFASEAFEDFSGGVMERYRLKHASAKTFDNICKALKRNVFITCDLFNSTSDSKKLGLVSSHAYSLTGAVSIKLNNQCEENLLRIRNPWGQREWKGRYSDDSKEWNNVPDKTKRSLQLVSKDDGEFWMTFSDFQRYFENFGICNLNPDLNMTDPNPARKWNLVSFEGESQKEFSVEFLDPDTDDDEDFCTVVIALMQKDVRKVHKVVEPFGFKIVSLSDKRMPVIEKFKPDNYLREMCFRFELPPGKYSIKPFTMNKNAYNVQFLLRVFFETKNNSSIYPRLMKNQAYKKPKNGYYSEQAYTCEPLKRSKRKQKACNVM